MSDKLVFMVAESDANLLNEIANLLKTNFEGAVVYTAQEGSEALKKMRNVPPKLLVSGMELGAKVTLTDLFRSLNQEKAFQSLPILVLSDLADKAPTFANDMAAGRMKFLSMPLQKEEFLSVVRSILQAEAGGANSFGTITLKSNEVLFLEGEKAASAYLLKKGRLEATRVANGQKVVLGQVLPGEFVGEMAHITGDPRSADVRAVEDSELIEIPCGTLDLLVFSKPTWTKALLKTMARRLREANLQRA